jgi:hypothetical protein
MSRAPARSRSAIASARAWAGSRPASSAACRVRHSHLPWWPGSAWWQGGGEQVAVALLAGQDGLGGPDGVQEGEVVGVGQGLAAGLGGRLLLAVAVQDGGQHAQRLTGRRGKGGRGGYACSFGMNLVVAGQLGRRPRPGYRVGLFRGGGEDVGVVVVGAAGQGNVGVLAVLGPGDDGQAGVDGAALGGVVGDRVAELGIFIVGGQEVTVGPAALPGERVGVQGPADDQPGGGDALDAEQVAVGQGAAGHVRLGGVVVTGADDQVPGAGLGAIGDADCRAAGDDAEGDEVVADAAGQLAAQRVADGHQQRVGAVGGQGDVGGGRHLLGAAAGDAGVLVVLGEHGGVAVAEPQARLLLPAGAEPDRLGQPGVAEGAAEQGHAAAVFYRLELAGVPGQDDLAVAGFGAGDQVGQVRGGHRRGLIDEKERARADRDGAAGAAAAGQVTQELGGVEGHRDPGGQGVAGGLGRGDPDHRAQACRSPYAGDLGQDTGLARPGGSVDH